MDFRSIQRLVFTIVTVFRLLAATNVSIDVCESSKIQITPPRATVKYGDPFSATCTISEETDFEKFTWEHSEKHSSSQNGTVLDLIVPNATSWDMAPICFITTVDGSQCITRLHVTLYKPPDSVSISFNNHSGPMDKGGQYELQCDINNIAPVRNLTVTFYRGDDVIGTALPASDTNNEPVNHIVTLNITARGTDNGAQYWCDAMLILGGPHPPPVVRSQNLTATVHYKPTIGYANKAIRVTEGDTLNLDCSSLGNPPPQYTWNLPPSVNIMSENATLIIHNVLTSQSGNYTCRATNVKGQDELIFTVDISVDLLPIFAGLAAAGVLLLLAICYFVYYTHYRHNHIGRYTLTDVLRFRNSNLVAQPNGI